MKLAKKTSHATMLISKKIPKLPRVRGEGWRWVNMPINDVKRGRRGRESEA